MDIKLQIVRETTLHTNYKGFRLLVLDSSRVDMTLSNPTKEEQRAMV